MDQVLCRLCLAPSNSTVALFDDDTMQPNVLLLQKVVECTSIRLSAEEDYPSSVCCECERKLNEWSTFKIQCIVNNDFYRQKQRELRRKLVAAQQQQQQQLQPPKPSKSPEVVCLDDDEETVPVSAPAKVEQLKPKESPAKRAKVVAEVVIEDDDDDDDDQNKDQYLNNEDGLLLEDDEEALLNDYQLVEGQEYPSESDYETSLQQNQQSVDHYENSTAILSSILLDDDDDDDEYEESRQNPGSGGPFQCWQCRRGYSSLTKLRMHEKLHSERMKCFVCGKMIVLQLVRHMRSQHPGQIFPEPVRCWHSKCANSPVVYYTVDQLLEHMDSKKRK